MLSPPREERGETFTLSSSSSKTKKNRRRRKKRRRLNRRRHRVVKVVVVVASVFWSPSSLEQSLVSSKKKEKLFLQVYGMCCCVSDRSVYETYRDGLCYSVVKMEILSPIELDFRLFVPNRTFSRVVCDTLKRKGFSMTFFVVPS